MTKPSPPGRHCRPAESLALENAMKSCWKSSSLLMLVGVASLSVLSAWAGSEQRKLPLAAELMRYDVPGGQTIFALALKGNLQDDFVPRDHVILVDTSASQAGAHRQQGLDVLDSCLASLGKSDRVQLYAVETQVQPLSQNFS